jgi:hypothetical protein
MAPLLSRSGCVIATAKPEKADVTQITVKSDSGYCIAVDAKVHAANSPVPGYIVWTDGHPVSPLLQGNSSAHTSAISL